MTINLEDNEILLRCACFGMDHMAMLIHEPEDSRDNNLKGVDDDWYLKVMLDPVSFRKRLWRGLKYIFRPNLTGYGFSLWVEIVLRNEDVEALATFIKMRLALRRGLD